MSSNDDFSSGSGFGNSDGCFDDYGYGYGDYGYGYGYGYGNDYVDGDGYNSAQAHREIEHDTT